MNPQQQTPPLQGMDPPGQVAAQLKNANNILVTVSGNPSVDQLTAAIGTTLVLNKLGKHATAVFSGQVPSILEFLQPDKTIEKTTDSLRDFIIALDKAKADKLRYKVEDKFVRIYITPYHTSLSEKDLEFSLGDYNVEVVLALGVKKKNELDQAITSHGRILHDAAVISVNTGTGADIGSINLNDPNASSLSEIMFEVVDQLKDQQTQVLDEQIATAFLTGIVAETERFSNSKTKPQTMSVAAKLMNSGANQQLIATKLEKPPPPPPPPPAAPKVPPKPPQSPSPATPTQQPGPGTLPSAPTATKPVAPPKSDDGTIAIKHEDSHKLNILEDNGEAEENIDRIHIDEQGTLQRLVEVKHDQPKATDSRKVVDSPPKLGGQLSANTQAIAAEPSSDPLSQTNKSAPLLEHPGGKAPDLNPMSTSSNKEGQTLSQIEQGVDSPHLKQQIGEAKPGGTLGADYPTNLVDPNKELPPDKTAGDSSEPKAPPVPPPFNLSDPNSGVPL